MSKFIIGDVHGCFDTLQALIKQLPENADVVFVGDLIDRGPKSKEIVDFIIEKGYDCVLGNHEQMMLDEYDQIIDHIARTGIIPKQSLWTLNGGYNALCSYELIDETIEDDRGAPLRLFEFDTFEKHMEWMKTLPIYLEYNEEGWERPLVVSHSVVHNVWNQEDNNNKLFKEVALWGRSFHNLKDKGFYNVIGHTPQEGGPTIKKIYANVDTGCFYKEQGFKTLTCLQYPEMKVYQQELIDDVRW